MIALLGYALFCAIALGTPDINLIGGSIKLPFVNTDVSFRAFLYVGPLVLLALTAYLHIFVGELHTLGTRQQVSPLPYLFNIHRPVPRMLSGIWFYAVPPLLCYIFAWKALPWQDFGPPLVVLASLMTIVLITLFAKRSRMRFFLPPRSLSELGASASWLGLAAVCIVALAAGAVNIAGRGHRVLDLERADLQGRDLVGWELRRADLFHARLQRADLSHANLEKANLALANLERATLYWA
jgi:hypothetical protein